MNTKRILQLRLRKAIISNRFGKAETSGYDLLLLIKQLLEVDFEILHIRQDLYLSLIAMFRHYNGSDPERFLKKVDFSSYKQKTYFGERYLYIWSRDFNRVENDYLLELLLSR